MVDQTPLGALGALRGPWCLFHLSSSQCGPWPRTQKGFRSDQEDLWLRKGCGQVTPPARPAPSSSLWLPAPPCASWALVTRSPNTGTLLPKATSFLLSSGSPSNGPAPPPRGASAGSQTHHQDPAESPHVFDQVQDGTSHHGHQLRQGESTDPIPPGPTEVTPTRPPPNADLERQEETGDFPTHTPVHTPLRHPNTPHLYTPTGPHTHLYTHTQGLTHTPVQTPTATHTRLTCTHTCTHTHRPPYTPVYTYLYTHLQPPIHTCIPIPVHTHAHTSMPTHTYSHLHTPTHADAYTPFPADTSTHPASDGSKSKPLGEAMVCRAEAHTAHQPTQAGSAPSWSGGS